ncbi:MAR-binding filament-like protein 1 isoform X1 [Brassica rapa]|uniref:MAR-binding filament-like protein 1 isoform X1 n=1 Tax=Brassica campestris TaxID=3711 RepID=UPI00087278D0|nr:MAR-binding filament-like protein 1 isoform X1 [Brassica rapa]XP_033144410.1 MAR-binding filament-like protein 1 isoform X1 [Brassica rapa]XP_033144411.1 MAR-binding filament-like protein 1 isoform X1 [Brassica rapa]
MKKLFFFKSSSGNNATDKHILGEKESETSPKSGGGGGHALRRSRSLSSAAFLLDGTSSTGTRSSRQQTHSSRFRCFTPESQGEHGRMYNDSSPSLSSTCSSNVLDRFIDGEDHHSKPKSGSSSHSNHHHSGSAKGRRLPPRVHTPSPLSDHVQESCMKDASARSLSRSVVERLSHNTHGESKALSYDSKEPMNGYYRNDHRGEEQESFLDDENMHVGTNHAYKEGELEKKYKEAEKRVKLLSQDLKEHKFLSDCDFDVSSLVDDEKIGLALEVLTLLRSQMDERASAKEEIKRAKTDSDSHINRLEKEKSQLQFELEKELDRRSMEWTTKLESFQMEEKRLRERVRELAEHNVSLQREVSTFHEKETERIDMIRNMEERVNELSETEEETRRENVYLKQNLSKLQESYSGATEELDYVRRSFEEKEMECKDLHKSVSRLVRACGEQEKTIEGLRDSLSEETKKQPSEMVKRLQMEQMRLTRVEFSLRKEVESTKIEADSLRAENVCLRSYDTMTTFKLDNEMKMRVGLLQDQGVMMLSETTQLCYKLLKFIRERLSEDMHNGLSEQFLIESEMNVHGIRRGTESLKRSLQTVNSLLLEKANEIASNSESSRSTEPNNQSVEKLLRAELKAETLVTSLLREKLYSKEQEIEQLQAEVAAGVRGNEVLQREIQNVLDSLSINTHQLKDLKIQMVKKEENVKRLETNLQEVAKQLSSMKVTLPKVLEEREKMCKEVNDCRKRNMDLESEKEMLKEEVERLEEDTLLKEGQITILKDTLGSKHFDLLSSPDFSYNEFLVQ